MKTEITYPEICKILNAELTQEQAARAFESAASDSEFYRVEDIPENVEDGEWDWQIDRDLREAGVNGYAMQRLSFAIVRLESERANA